MPRVVVLPGDGIGPEVTSEARRALAALAPDVTLDEQLLGAAAIRATGAPLPAETLAACRTADAVLKAPVGDPEFDAAPVRPEQGTLQLRAALDVFANVRPCIGRGADLVIVRELVGGLYYGRRGTFDDGTVFDTLEYHPDVVERILRFAFELARSRRGDLTSIDKANVLDTSRLWRHTADEVATDYPDVRLRHLLVDAAAVRVATSAAEFDVVVTENMFGDILSDLAAGVTGGLGVAPSASLGDAGPGVFEPVHGSAPDIAGRGIANPAAMLRTTALLLQHGLGRPRDAERLRAAVDVALAETPTPDLGGTASTHGFADRVLQELA